MGPEVLRLLAAQGVDIALDVQGFVRVVREGRLEHDAWPGRQEVLALVRFLKADAVEAAQLTGTDDLQKPRGLCTSRDRGRSC